MIDNSAYKTRQSFSQWLILGLILLALGGSLGYSLFRQYRHTEAEERERLITQARVIDENVKYQIAEVNLTLAGIRDDLPYWKKIKGDRARINWRLRVLSNAMQGVRTINIHDAKGAVVASNRDELIGRNFSERQYFKIPRQTPDKSMLYVSPPFKTVLGVWGINLTRVILGAKGEFNGIVTATLDPEYFKVILESVLYAPDMRSSINHGDGKVFIIIPTLKDVEGMDLAKPGSFFTRHVESGQTASFFKGRVYATGDESMIAIRTVKSDKIIVDKPLMVAVSRDLSAIFASWRKEAIVQSGLCVALALVAAFGLYLYQRREQKFKQIETGYVAELQESEERFRSLFENAHVIALVIDPSDGLIIDANLAASVFYGWPIDKLRTMKISDINTLSKEDIKKEMELAQSQQRMHFMFQHRRADGSIRDVEVYSGPIKFGDKTLLYSIIHDITTQKLAEDALVRSEDSLKKAQQYARIGSWTWDIKTNQLQWSDQMFHLFGIEKESFTGSLPEVIAQAIHPEDRPKVEEANLNVINNKQPVPLEYRVIWPDQSVHVVWAEAGELLLDKDGKTYLLTGTVQDITERKKIEAEKEQFYKFFQTTADIMVIADPNGAFMKTNHSCTEILGYSEAELVAKPFIKFIHPEDKQSTLDEMARQLKRGFSLNFENRYICKDGSVKWLSWRATYVKEEGITYATAHDITELKKVEQELFLSDVIIKNIAEGINIVRLEDGTIIYANRRFENMLGYEPDELIGQDISIVNAPTDKTPDEIKKAIIDAILATGVWHGEIKNIRKDGTQCWCYASVSVFDYHEHGKVSLAVHSDITDRKKTEDALKESHERLITVLDSLDAIVYVSDMKTYELLFVSEYLRSNFGDIARQLCWKTIQSGQSGPCSFCSNDKLIDDMGNPTGTYRWEFQNTINGRWYDIHDRALRWIDGRIVRLEIATDITDRKRTEDETKRALKEKETLLKEIHHRVKNNMAVVSSLLALQASNIKDDTVKYHLEESQLRVKSMALVHEKLYQTKDLSAINFRDYITSLISEVAGMHQSDSASIKTEISVEDIELDINTAVPCGLIINELLTNAFKYAFRGKREGVLSVRLSKADETCTLIIKDNGVGLPEGFDYEKATTLGLQLVSGLTKQIGGTIQVKSEKGTEVTVVFKAGGK